MVLEQVQAEQEMALADFLRDFHDTPFELIHGKRILWMPNLAGHSELIEQIKNAFNDYLREKPVGEVRTEATFIVEHRKNWIKGALIPDILFYSGERLATYKAENPDWSDKPYVLVPDLTIEIVSKNDQYSDINKKVWVYLECGVKAIWVIDPHSKTAFVHGLKKTLMLGEDDSIRDVELLPSFELPLKPLFG